MGEGKWQLREGNWVPLFGGWSLHLLFVLFVLGMRKCWEDGLVECIHFDARGGLE